MGTIQRNPPTDEISRAKHFRDMKGKQNNSTQSLLHKIVGLKASEYQSNLLLGNK